MDLLCTMLLLLSLAVLLLIPRALKKYPGPGKPGKLPPGPSPLPIIGNIHQLGRTPHESLARLSQIHGPVIMLKLGSLTSVVVSSPEAARAVLQKHDQVCCNRPIPEAAKVLDHHRHSVGWLPVDNKWRKLRKLCREKMFSVQKLESSQALRAEKLRDLGDYVGSCGAAGQAVDVGAAAFTSSLNLLSSSLFSKDVAEFGSNSSMEFRDIVRGFVSAFGKPNLADYFPMLRTTDPQGIFRESKDWLGKFLAVLDEIIRQRAVDRERASDGDMFEALLEFNQEDGSGLNFDDIRHLISDLFVAGSETISTTVEWAMAELIHNPDKMLKAKHELEGVFGANGQVQESDISRLPYLRAIVKETLRLHPPAPLLLPHKADKDIEIDGYIVPRDAQILINIWAIGRDPNVWQDPAKFVPERFVNSEIDYGGQHFELTPFGGGRRICLGLPLAHRMIHLMLVTLVRNFEWQMEEGMKPEDIDMDEKFSFFLQKAIPLWAIPLRTIIKES